MPRAVILAWIFFLALVAEPVGAQAPNSEADEAILGAFHAAYSLDHDVALAHARRAVVLAPQQSRAHRTLAAVTWIDMLFRRGAVTIDHYLRGLKTDSSKDGQHLKDADAIFKKEIATAIELAERRLQANPKDVRARYDLGGAYALQASYAASIEDSMTSAFGSAKRAFNAQEQVLEEDPGRRAAGVVVGTYRYLVSRLKLPTRMVAYVLGFGGGKAEGIELLTAAANDREAHVEAKTALALIFSREGRHRDAMQVLGELAAEFPRNRIYVLEQASAGLRAGRTREAEALLTSGLAALDADTRPTMPGERALWLYKRGSARLARNLRREAAADLHAALGAAPTPWVEARTRLTLGKVADLDGRRDAAVTEYRTARGLGEQVEDRLSVAEANRLMKQPFALAARP